MSQQKFGIGSVPSTPDTGYVTIYPKSDKRMYGKDSDGTEFSLSGGGGGSGTVTTVSVTTANGVSGSVANATTTPAISLTLGAITPTSVAASGSVSGSNLSGTNTGDQTITLTGDVTGSGTGSFATTIGALKVTNSMLAGSIAASKLVGTDIDTVGTVTTGTWSATTIAANKMTVMVGDSGSGGTQGVVPAPAAGDAAASKFLKADGTWAAPSGAGTVTSVSVTTANGVSGSVANATSTPAISLTLGAITPTSVAASGSVTGSNLSGTNTGDQTITLTGDVTGSGTGSFATTIGALKVTNSMLAGSIAAAKLVGTDIDTVGTITTGTWNATTIAANKMTVMVGDSGSGGTQGAVPAPGAGDAAANKFLKANGTWATTPGTSSPLTTKGDLYTYSTVDARLGVGTNGQVLTADSAEATGLKWTTVSGTGDVSSNTATSVVDEIALFADTTGKLIKRSTGTGVAHLTSGVLSASNVALSSEVTGVLPVANGGTNSSTALSNNRVMVSSGSAVVEAAAITASKALVSDANGIPVASTATGIVSLNSGAVTGRTITAGTGVSVTNGDGTAGNPTIALSSNALISSIGTSIDGGGSAITTGVKGDISVPFSCTINSVTLLADQTGSIVIDIWKDTYANYPPTVADTITASAKPTISSSNKATDATLTGWTTSVTAGDTIRFNVDSCSTITKCTLVLKVTRT